MKKNVLLIFAVVSVLTTVVTGKVRAVDCIYSECVYEIPQGTARPVPETDVYCCDQYGYYYSPPCEFWPGTVECWSEKQVFLSPAAAQGLGTGDIWGVSLMGTFTYDLYTGECEEGENGNCVYTKDPNGPYTGMTSVCYICV